MSHPINFVEYACGHSEPVKGAGGVAKRLCRFCSAQTLTPNWNWYVPTRAINLASIMGHDKHPGPYCKCDICQSRIP